MSYRVTFLASSLSFAGNKWFQGSLRNILQIFPSSWKLIQHCSFISFSSLHVNKWGWQGVATLIGSVFGIFIKEYLSSSEITNATHESIRHNKEVIQRVTIIVGDWPIHSITTYFSCSPAILFLLVSQMVHLWPKFHFTHTRFPYLDYFKRKLNFPTSTSYFIYT